MKISIIGTAGRGKPWTYNLYSKAYKVLKIELNSFENYELISGGAAGADHLAISLHKQIDVPLTLHLPCKFDLNKKEFDRSKESGRIANYYHRKFQRDLEKEENNSLYSIFDLISNNKIQTKIHNGFHARNKLVAESDLVIAFTWGKDSPPAGGTKHTWDLAKDKKRIHISLSAL